MTNKQKKRLKQSIEKFATKYSEGPCAPIAVAMAMPELRIDDIFYEFGVERRDCNTGNLIIAFNGYHTGDVIDKITNLSPKTPLRYNQLPEDRYTELKNHLKNKVKWYRIYVMQNHMVCAYNGELLEDLKTRKKTLNEIVIGVIDINV